MSRKNIKGFDGIRGLAVLSVVLTHLHVFEFLKDAGVLSDRVMPMIQGGTGVQAFFVLSGFLITTLLIREIKATGTVSIRNFIIRRTLRIFPLYILFLLLATLLHVLGENVTTWPSLLFAYAYSYNFVPIEHYTGFLGHTWSLAVEEHFYLLWPVTFLVGYRRSPGVLALFLGMLVVCSAVLHLLLVRMGLDARFFVERWTIVAGYSIALGCLAAIVVGRTEIGDAARRYFGGSAFIVGATVCFASSLYVPGNSWFLGTVGTAYIRALGICMFVVWVYCNQTNSLVSALEVRPLRYIGEISYGVYMYQGLFLSTGPDRDPAATWPPSPLVGLMLLILVAPLSYRYFERPFLRIKDRFAGPRRPEAMDTVM